MNTKTYDVWSYEVLSEFTEPDGREMMRVRFQVSIGSVQTQKEMTVTREQFRFIIDKRKFKTHRTGGQKKKEVGI